MSNRKYKVKLLSLLRLRDLKIVFKHSLFKNSLSNIKNSVFKDWDARRKQSQTFWSYEFFGYLTFDNIASCMAVFMLKV